MYKYYSNQLAVNINYLSCSFYVIDPIAIIEALDSSIFNETCTTFVGRKG